MRELRFLEKLAENLFEGGFLRALKPRLQPVQLAKGLAKEMDRSHLVGPEGLIVANQYRVYLSPEDYALFSGFQLNLERELSSYLRDYASRRNYRPIGSVSVSLRASETQSMGRVKTEALMIDSSPASPEPRPNSEWLGGTMEMAAVNLEAAQTPARLPTTGQPPAALVAADGAVIRLEGPITQLGRAVDNDVVLEPKSVSRRHAQIRWEAGRYLLEDLGSTNGTFVSGQRVGRHTLSDGDEIALGEVAFIFRQADH
jgi:hypothetical protein